jgi:hypothetical protein
LIKSPAVAQEIFAVVPFFVELVVGWSARLFCLIRHGQTKFLDNPDNNQSLCPGGLILRGLLLFMLDISLFISSSIYCFSSSLSKICFSEMLSNFHRA